MPKAAATSSRRAAPSARPAPNLFLPAAAIRMELLEGAGGGGVAVDGGGACSGVAARGEEDETEPTLPDSISRCRRLRSARSSAATWYGTSRTFSRDLLR